MIDLLILLTLILLSLSSFLVYKVIAKSREYLIAAGGSFGHKKIDSEM